jgi:hypothetical protein
MPSPIGHALAGVAAGWLVGGRVWPAWHLTIFRFWRRRADAHPPATVGSTGVTAVAYALAATLPDLDLLVGTHNAQTHSLGAVALAFTATLAVTRWLLPTHAVTAHLRSLRFAGGVAAAWASHLLLDWLGSDTRAPIGIMALWPLTSAHYQSSLHLFDAISRRYWLPEQFVWGNLRAALREILVLGPVAGLCYWITYVRQPQSHKGHQERTEK